MARRSRRRPKTRTITRTVVRKTARRKSTSGPSPTTLALGGAAYGAAREPISNALSSVLGNIPVVAQLGDETALALIHYFGAKKVQNKNLKAFFRAGLVVEASRIGANLSGNLMPSTSANNNSIDF